MSKVLIISSSLRAKSNSEILAAKVAEGAKDAGHEVETVSLKGKKIAYCVGCLACQKLGKCVQKDDAAEITETVKRADTVVFVTPIYYYEMSGQLKTLLDRMNPLYGTDYSFRNIYLLTTAADDAEETPDRALGGIGGWIDCFERAELKGSLFCGGLEGPGDAQKNAEYLEAAYNFGKSLE
jgi:multimeric flavodoxin WrbA